MFIGCLEVNLKIEGALSLKDKRMVIKSIKDKLKARFNASVAETAEQDKWQIGVIGLAFVSDTEGGAKKEAGSALDYIYELFDIEVISHSITVYNTEDSK